MFVVASLSNFDTTLVIFVDRVVGKQSHLNIFFSW